MAANGSGLQWATVRNLLMAWVLTLPVAIMLIRRPLLNSHVSLVKCYADRASELDKCRRHKAAVEERIVAIKEEEALASVNHTVAEVDKWEGARLGRTKFVAK